MDKAFIYGMSVEGKNFTDRELETKRLQLNFENISEESEEPNRR